MNRVDWRFDFVGGTSDEEDPPQIWITKDGYDWLRVLEKPTRKGDNWDVPSVVPQMVKLLETMLNGPIR